ncbi:MAG: PTS sugar transporter subunit IIA [Treponema sp.]|jgi:mannitol/fructose-specific phosphotransferase system IIA component (Ntr-type)|nr:PTS sugar transporter subunit IIA [Treponema sp.]
MGLADIFDTRLIKLNLESTDKAAVFEELSRTIAAVKPELNQGTMLAILHDREGKMNTSVAPGVAVPHGYFPGLNRIIGAVGFSLKGIEYSAPDHKPVHLVFMLLLGEGERKEHLHVLNQILTFVKFGALSYIRDAGTPQQAYDMLCRVG